MQEATPDDTATVTQPEMLAPPLVNVTVPGGVPHPETEHVTAAVRIADVPYALGLGFAVRFVVVGTLTTLCVSVPVDGPKLLALVAVNTALREFDPSVRVDVGYVATPDPLTAAEPSRVDPTLNATVPVTGAPEAGVTVAVSVNIEP